MTFAWAFLFVWCNKYLTIWLSTTHYLPQINQYFPAIHWLNHPSQAQPFIFFRATIPSQPSIDLPDLHSPNPSSSSEQPVLPSRLLAYLPFTDLTPYIFSPSIQLFQAVCWLSYPPQRIIFYSPASPSNSVILIYLIVWFDK